MNSPTSFKDNSPSIDGMSRNLGQNANIQQDEEERARNKNHKFDTLKKVLIKCNYKWDTYLKNITDSHSGQSTRSFLDKEYETVASKIKLDQHLRDQNSMSEIDEPNPVQTRGYLTRTALAHKLKLISAAEIQKRYVQKGIKLSRRDIRSHHNKSVVKPVVRTRKSSGSSDRNMSSTWDNSKIQKQVNMADLNRSQHLALQRCSTNEFS